MNREDQIIEYLEGNLSKDDKIAFESELAENEYLKNEVELYKKVIAGIESEGAAELKEYLQQRLSEPELKSNSRAWMYAAATVSVLLIGYVAIFKYIQTGSIKETKDYITLKDESMNRLKFWRKYIGKEGAKSTSQTQTRSPYLDSIEMLDEAMALYNNDEINIAPVEEYAEENMADDALTLSEGTATANDVDYIKPNKLTDTLRLQENLIASITVKPISLKLDRPLKKQEISEFESDAGRAISESSTVKANSRLSAKESPSTVSSKDKEKSESKNKPQQVLSKIPKTANSKTINVVKIDLVRTDENKQIIIEQWENNLKLKLINISGENPLVYHIGEKYYLQIQNNIYELNGITCRTEDPKLVEDRAIIGIILSEE